MRFDQQDGTLWLTGYSEGKLARITNSSHGFESKVYSLPEWKKAMAQRHMLWAFILKLETFGSMKI